MDSGAAESISVRDKIIYGISVLLLALLSFLASSIYNRLGNIELLVRDLSAWKTQQDAAQREDHVLLMDISKSRNERTEKIAMLEQSVAANNVVVLQINRELAAIQEKVTMLQKMKQQ